MCLSIPSKIVSINDGMAEVEVSWTIVKASLQLLPEAGVGDYVLVHAGFAIQLLDEDEAFETLRMLEEIDETR